MKKAKSRTYIHFSKSQNLSSLMTFQCSCNTIRMSGCIVFQHKSILIGLFRRICIILFVKVKRTFDKLEKIVLAIKLQMQTLTLNSSTCPLVKAIIMSCSAIPITSTLELNVIILIFGCDDTEIASYSTLKPTNTQLCVFKNRCRSSRLSDLRLIHHQEITLFISQAERMKLKKTDEKDEEKYIKEQFKGILRFEQKKIHENKQKCLKKCKKKIQIQFLVQFRPHLYFHPHSSVSSHFYLKLCHLSFCRCC